MVTYSVDTSGGQLSLLSHGVQPPSLHMLYSCLPRLARLESKWSPASDVGPDADLFRSAVAGGGPLGGFSGGILYACSYC